MATNRDLLKEAIADAKAVKEMAITNAKLALEEAFTPHLKSMLSTKLQEMEEVEEEMEEKSMYTEEDTEIVKEEEEVEMEAEETESVMDEESMDLEDMSEEDLKSFIEDVISDMVESGELEAGENMEEEDMEDMEDMKDMEDMEDMKDGEMETEEEMEEEVSIDELLAEIDSMYEDDPMEEMYSTYEMKDDGMIEGDEQLEEISLDISDTVAAISMIAPALAIATGFGVSYIKDKLKTAKTSKELEAKAKEIADESKKEKLDEVEVLRSELNEINLLNAKLLYTNKIFKGKNLTESQKVEVLENFDKTTTVKEVKLVYETLLGAIKTSKNRISENLGSASKSTGTTKKPIIEANDAFSRMREIAFYSTKH